MQIRAFVHVWESYRALLYMQGSFSEIYWPLSVKEPYITIYTKRTVSCWCIERATGLFCAYRALLREFTGLFQQMSPQHKIQIQSTVSCWCIEKVTGLFCAYMALSQNLTGLIQQKRPSNIIQIQWTVSSWWELQVSFVHVCIYGLFCGNFQRALCASCSFFLTLLNFPVTNYMLARTLTERVAHLNWLPVTVAPKTTRNYPDPRPPMGAPVQRGFFICTFCRRDLAVRSIRLVVAPAV